MAALLYLPQVPTASLWMEATMAVCHCHLGSLLTTVLGAPSPPLMLSSTRFSFPGFHAHFGETRQLEASLRKTARKMNSSEIIRF